jgi:type II secretory pathway pseudopilin PulG
MAIISMLAGIAIPIYTNTIRQGREAVLTTDCKMLYDAMMRYYADHGSFPGEDELETDTLTPLAGTTYFTSGNALLGRVQGHRLTVYLAPDVGGENQQFIIVTIHKDDPSLVVVAVHSNIVGDGDDWVDGVYVISRDELEDAGDLG